MAMSRLQGLPAVIRAALRRVSWWDVATLAALALYAAWCLSGPDTVDTFGPYL
jgi:hypothetical protein